jgi:hypothetical protein
MEWGFFRCCHRHPNHVEGYAYGNDDDDGQKSPHWLHLGKQAAGHQEQEHGNGKRQGHDEKGPYGMSAFQPWFPLEGYGLCNGFAVFVPLCQVFAFGFLLSQGSAPQSLSISTARFP